MIRELAARGIGAVFHYVPLHSAPAGERFGRTVGDLSNTTRVSERLLRLPIWVGLEPHLDEVIDAVRASASRGRSSQ